MAMAEVATAGRREQILEAALRVIGRSGRQAVTHRAVAEEAGVPLGSTTYYFDSRDDLLGRRSSTSQRARSSATPSLARSSTVKSARELADRLIDELVAAAKDRIA